MMADTKEMNMSKRITPSRLRDRLESRVRKVARTYSKREQLQAADESIDLWTKYREQLLSDINKEK
jgi:hypothetical protein